eukprot:11074738-Lingulodinium_polyedra.AAC.1
MSQGSHGIVPLCLTLMANTVVRQNGSANGASNGQSVEAIAGPRKGGGRCSKRGAGKGASRWRCGRPPRHEGRHGRRTAPRGRPARRGHRR